MRILKRDVGRYCNVRYTDTGLVTGIIVDTDPSDRWVSVFLMGDRSVCKPDRSQIEKLGEYVMVPEDAI